MNEDDVLTQLRDIHLIGELDTGGTSQFAAWPFVVFAVVVGALMAARLWRRHRWRRSARADLSQIVSIEDDSARWAKLLTFACGLSARSGRAVNLPETAFLPLEIITEEQQSDFVAFLHAQLR